MDKDEKEGVRKKIIYFFYSFFIERKSHINNY